MSSIQDPRPSRGGNLPPKWQCALMLPMARPPARRWSQSGRIGSVTRRDETSQAAGHVGPLTSRTPPAMAKITRAEVQPGSQIRTDSAGARHSRSRLSSPESANRT